MPTETMQWAGKDKRRISYCRMLGQGTNKPAQHLHADSYTWTGLEQQAKGVSTRICESKGAFNTEESSPSPSLKPCITPVRYCQYQDHLQPALTLQQLDNSIDHGMMGYLCQWRAWNLQYCML